MNSFESLLLNIIYLIVPLVIYILYQVYSKTLSKEKNELYLDIALISSFYLIKQYGIFSESNIPYLLLNIPLVIAYIKKRYLGIGFISMMVIIFYNEQLNFPIILLLLEYLSYFIIYQIVSKKGINRIEILYISLFIKCIIFFGQLYEIDIITYISEVLVSTLVFFLVTIIILTLLKKTEDIIKLHKTIQELEEEKQIRESLFKITHEIKNPIAVCKGYLDMFDTNNIEHSRKYIPIIKSEIERVLILLQDFLSITKIKVELDIIDLNMLFEEVVDSFVPLIKDRKIKIITNINEEELYIMADYNRLSQVFINLIKNSIEALEEKKSGRIKVNINEDKNNIIIKVIDNGTGISEENLKRMNKPFFTTKNNGTGLGVYLSTEIVKAHNGTINYESNNKGTTATVTLPYKKGY